MKPYWRGSYYYLALLCLVITIVLLQARPMDCCGNLQTWLPSVTPPIFSKVEDAKNTTKLTPITEQEVLGQEVLGQEVLEQRTQEQGYVFSFLTSVDGLESTLPQSTLAQPQIQEEVTEDISFEASTLDSTITTTSTSINLLNTAKSTLLEASTQRNIFSFSTIIILLASSIMQGASGFAFSLLMMPLLVWNGFSLVEANIFTATNGFVLSCFMVFKLRESVMWKVLWPSYIPRIGGMVMGILLLSYLNGLDKALIRQILGVVLLLTVVIQLVVKVKPRDQLHRGWWWLGFGSSGLLGGMVGFGGPPVVLWVMAHNWSNIQSRALMAALYWTIVPIQVAMLLMTFGRPLAQFSLQALFFVPVVVGGVFAGILLGNLLNKPRLRKFVQALLLVTAIMSLIGPYIGLA